jgi:hypothetical protein
MWLSFLWRIASQKGLSLFRFLFILAHKQLPRLLTAAFPLAGSVADAAHPLNLGNRGSTVLDCLDQADQFHSFTDAPGFETGHGSFIRVHVVLLLPVAVEHYKMAINSDDVVKTRLFTRMTIC